MLNNLRIGTATPRSLKTQLKTINFLPNSVPAVTLEVVDSLSYAMNTATQSSTGNNCENRMSNTYNYFTFTSDKNATNESISTTHPQSKKSILLDK